RKYVQLSSKIGTARHPQPARHTHTNTHTLSLRRSVILAKQVCVTQNNSDIQPCTHPHTHTNMPVHSRTHTRKDRSTATQPSCSLDCTVSLTHTHKTQYFQWTEKFGDASKALLRSPTTKPRRPKAKKKFHKKKKKSCHSWRNS